MEGWAGEEVQPAARNTAAKWGEKKNKQKGTGSVREKKEREWRAL